MLVQRLSLIEAPNYKEVTDQSAIVTFSIKDNINYENTSLLAWTTTP